MQLLCAACTDCESVDGSHSAVVSHGVLLDEGDCGTTRRVVPREVSSADRSSRLLFRGPQGALPADESDVSREGSHVQTREGTVQSQTPSGLAGGTIWQSMASNVAAELCTRVEQELATSQVQNYEVCAGSTSLAMLWGQFFQASDNAAFRNVALQVSPEPKSESLHFVVDLKRRSPMQRFGVECTDIVSDPGVLVITGVERGGCVENWNDHCSQLSMPWKRLHLCAAITAVNGISGNARRMKQELGQSGQVILVACNPPSLCDAVMLLRAVRAAAPLQGRPFWVGGQANKAALKRGMPIRPIPRPAYQAIATGFGLPAKRTADVDAAVPASSPPPRAEPDGAAEEAATPGAGHLAMTPPGSARDEDEEAARTPPDPEADNSPRSPPLSRRDG